MFCHMSAITDGNMLQEGSRVDYDESYDDRKGKPRAERVTGGVYVSTFRSMHAPKERSESFLFSWRSAVRSGALVSEAASEAGNDARVVAAAAASAAAARRERKPGGGEEDDGSRGKG